MTTVALQELEILNFRSIRGRVIVPLDAQVILVQGKNGAGKTSVLSALELALTGNIQAFRRADPNFATQLLHWSSGEGRVEVRALSPNSSLSFNAQFNAEGLTARQSLPPQLAAFFAERAYLPQSLLGQLLQIYQESDSGMDSPLAKFVGDLLGLDRLDALEAGLKPLTDVRNVRKLAPAWSEAETEKSRLQRLLADQDRSRDGVTAELNAALGTLGSHCASLDIKTTPANTALNAIEAELDDSHDEALLSALTDRQRQLASIRREAAVDASNGGSSDETALAATMSETGADLNRWEASNLAQFEGLRGRVAELLPERSLAGGYLEFREQALILLRSEQERLASQATRANNDAERIFKIKDELAVARRQLATVDEEIGRIAANTGGLSATLAELTGFITDETCPVCDRDFRQVSSTPLVEHVHGKVRTLSASAQRLLTLGRSRGEQQTVVERLEGESQLLTARQLEPRELTELGRQMAAFEAVIARLDALKDVLAEGTRLTVANVAARRAASERQTRDLARTAARQTLLEFAVSAGETAPQEDEPLAAAAARLATSFERHAQVLNARQATRRAARDAIATARAAIQRRDQIVQAMEADARAQAAAGMALQNGQIVREQGLKIRSAVDAVRSGIIRSEFNDRLNKLWRDLFVRLAPSEPFVPAFRIPQAGTQRLQPKLITEHRDGGGAGGAPGAMLSAGNLNTAALTLFLALHLSVPARLPWLILDDPVQSMDDVHTAHLAALLRTLSKEHRRQVMIAVHDRSLFEYLRLELSPAYPDDSLLTVELGRRAHRDTICVVQRLSFHEETALHQAA